MHGDRVSAWARKALLQRTAGREKEGMNMENTKTGRKVLLIIDVQEPFLSEQTQAVPEFLRELLQRERFDLVIQSCWQNYPGSPYETRLGYDRGMEARPLLSCPGEKVLFRSTYSAVNGELRGCIRQDDRLYVAGLETDACILATLFDLWDAGFSFHLYREGVGTNRSDLAEPALALISRQFGDEVLL